MALTAQQQAAVDAPADVHVALEATAGSGKTTVLGNRIVKLVEDYGILPENIVLATYSKSQSEDMALRIFSKHPQLKGSALENGFAPGVGQIATLHALARRLLVYYDPVLMKREVAPEWKERAIIERKVEDLEWTIRGELCGYKSILFWISHLKTLVDQDGEPIPWTKDTLENFMFNHVGARDAHNFAEVAVDYQRQLNQANMWTFGDMLRECELKMRHDKGFRDHWSRRFSHVLIDEAQDTSAQNIRIAGYLDATMFIVGDGDQVLYRFQGATPEVNLRDGFDERYGDNAQRFTMTRCFRCQPLVIDAARSLIRNNYDDRNLQYYKEIEGKEGDEAGPALAFSWHATPEDEAHEAVREIAGRIEAGEITPGDVMIMGRVNAMMAPVEIELLQANLPFVNLGMSSFFNRKIPKIIIAHMKLIVNPADWDAFEAIYNIPSKNFVDRDGDYCPTRYMGREFLDKLDRFAPKVLAEVSRNKDAKNKKGWSQWTKGVSDIEAVFSHLRTFTAQDNALAFISRLQAEVLDRWIEEEYGVEEDASESVRDDLMMMLNMGAKFTLAQFLEYVTQLQAVKNVKPEEMVDYILIGTVFRFKGLERPNVWVLGLSEKLLPHRFSLGDPAPTDGLPMMQVSTVVDERNIAYVAVTRAIRECHLSGTETWPTIKGQLEPSRFVEEMGVEVPVSERERIETELRRDAEAGYLSVHASYPDVEGDVHEFDI
jgi:superfamily I DNA/RNA helicase